MLRTVFVEAPLRFYAYADTGSAWARALGIGVMLGVMALGAGIGATIAALLHRDVTTAALVGMWVGCGLAVGYVVLMFALLLGAAIQEWVGPRPVGPRGRHAASVADTDEAEPEDLHVPWLWVIASFFGIVGAFVAVVSGVMAIGEVPFRGPSTEVLGEVLALDSDASGDRRATVRFVAEGEQLTVAVKLDDAADLTIDTEVGDQVHLEYQRSDPTRVRGAGQTEEMWATVVILGWVGGVSLGVAALVGGLAWLARPRRRGEPPT